MRKSSYSLLNYNALTIILIVFLGFSGLSAENMKISTVKNTYVLKPFDGPLANPHKGFTFPTYNRWCLSPKWEYGPGGSLNNTAWDVISYGSGYHRWDVLNPEKGVYDWTDLDKLLEDHEKLGLGYALRVLPYSSTKGAKNNYTVEEDYDWTPRFVYEQGCKKTYATITLDGVERTLAAPVWDDSIYLQAHKDFAVALAQKYDGDPRIEYIDIRCFGNWGEWHMAHFTGTTMPSVEIQKDMLSYYASVFHKTLLVLPSSGKEEVYEHALSLGITKRDDGLIGTPKREQTLIPAYEANLPTVAENIASYATMLTYTDVIPGGYLKWTLDRWKNVINVAHLTYYVLDQASDAGYQIYSEHKAEVDSMTKVIGYNFRITNADLTTVVDSVNSTNTLKLKVKNTGVAPCFFDVYLVAEFVDSTGTVLSQFGSTILIPKGTFKDEMTKSFEFTDSVPMGLNNIATMPGVRVALSLYESKEAYKNGKNPTVRFDNDGIQENKKLFLKSCSHEYGDWKTIKKSTETGMGVRRRICTLNCGSYEEETIMPVGLSEVFRNVNEIMSFAVRNDIYVTNVMGRIVYLYNSVGELYDKRIAKENEVHFSVQNSDVYFVVVGSHKEKVIVK